MKHITLFLILISVLLFSQHSIAGSEDIDDQDGNTLYSSIHAGTVLPMKADISTDYDQTVCSFETGSTISFVTGYKKERWRFEGEFSYQQLDFDILTTTPALGLTKNGNGDQTQYLLFANICYEPFSDWMVSPFIGGGIGLSLKTIQVNGVYDLNNPDPETGLYDNGLFNSNVSFRDTDGVKTYQFIAGLTCAVTKKIAIEAVYKIIDSDDANLLYGRFSNDNLNLYSLGVRYSY